MEAGEQVQSKITNQVGTIAKIFDDNCAYVNCRGIQIYTHLDNWKKYEEKRDRRKKYTR